MPLLKVLSTENLGLSKNAHNSSLRTQNCKSSGFTLIEVLVVLGIMVAAVGVTLLFLTNVLKGTNQANVGAEVKQNGQAVLDSLEKQIRGASDIECKDSGGTTVLCDNVDADTKYMKVLRVGQDPLHIRCFSSTSTTNGWIGTVVTSNDYPALGAYTSTTNNDTVSGVDVRCSPSDPPDNLGFKIIPTGSGLPPIVSISFVVNQGVSASSRADFLANVKFETTISLRKY